MVPLGCDRITAGQFRRIALGLPDAVEGAHMGHPDFRVGGRIFATIHDGNRTGMVKLTPDQQTQFVADFPRAFEPSAGAWGRGGATTVRFAELDEETAGEALTLAWTNVRATAKPVAKSRATSTRRRR